jgi:hypothetical protein
MKKLILAGIAVLALALGTAGAMASTATVGGQSTTTGILEAPAPAGANGEQAQSGELGQQGQGGEQGQSGELAQQHQDGEQGQANEAPAAGASAPK